MLDFQKIRNKQKWLFGLIAIPVIFGFVILFTPDAENWLFGRGDSGMEEGAYGQVDGVPVTRDQWLSARGLAGLTYGRFGDSYVEDKIPDVLVEMKLLEKYSINVSQTDVINMLNDQIAAAGEMGKQMHDEFTNLKRRETETFIRRQQHFMGVGQLRRLAGVGSGLISEKEAAIQYRKDNEQYEAEAIFISHTNYLPLVQIDDAKLQAYYTNSISKYRLSESRQLSYVTFPPTNYLDQAAVKYYALSPEEKKALLQSCWPTDTAITNQVEATIADLAKHVATVQTNEFEGMAPEAVQAQVQEKLLTTGVGLKAGLAVVEAYNAGEDFQHALRQTYDAKPGLDTLDQVALLQNLEVRTTPPMRRDLPFVPGLQRMTPAQVFALSVTNALVSGASSLSSAGNADPYFVASLKKITPARDRSFAEAKPLVTEDYKKAESIKLLEEAGEKLKQALKDEKSLADIAKENNFSVVKLGPFGSTGGAIEGLDTPILAEDIRAQVVNLEVGATSELNTSSTDNDVTDHEMAFLVKLSAKQAVSQETYDKEFSDHLKQARMRASSSAYTAWLDAKTKELYRYSLSVQAGEGGTVTVNNKPGDSMNYFESLEIVKLAAKPAPGFVFKEWDGLVRQGKTNGTNSVLVINNTTITAVFAPASEGAK